MGCMSSRTTDMYQPDGDNNGTISRGEFRAAYRREHYRGESPDSAAWSRYESGVRKSRGEPSLNTIRYQH